MSEIAVKVENLGKQYMIGGEKASYRTFRESVMQGIKAPFQRAAGLLRGESYSAAGLDQTIWALKNLNFEINQGEVVGVIGPNGAGKSTLLKVLSRITDPTEGRVLIKGRVGSLLEVGTGFHPELTGRENIYLNGSILGMHRKEIDRKFDEIIDFSGVEKFIDTPVKYYSSGMQVRLAFTVAAHLEPEILLVDEVLAVGDASFQKKSLGKMESVAHQGRTVVFVSHNMGMIQTLCERAILLDHGEIAHDSKTEKVIASYLDTVTAGERTDNFSAEPDPDSIFQILKVSTTDESSRLKTLFDINESVYVDIEYQLNEKTVGLAVTAKLVVNGLILLTTFDVDQNEQLLEKRDPGHYRIRLCFPPMHLKPGKYDLNIGGGVLNRERLDYVENAASFQVEALTVGTSFKSYSKRRDGLITMPIEWEII